MTPLVLPIDLSGDLVAQTPLWASVVGQVLIVAGALLFSTAAIGVIRLPDIYTRASAISTAAGFGLALVVAGTFFFVPGVDNAVKVVVAVILQLVASAVGSMTIARSAYLTGSAVYSPSHHDELGDSVPEADTVTGTTANPEEKTSRNTVGTTGDDPA